MIEAIIIGTNSQRIAVLEGKTMQDAENIAKQYLKDHGLKLITDIFSQGAYRAWVQ